MTQHYFSIFYDTKTSKWYRDDEVSLNFDQGKIWDEESESWAYAFEDDELENADENASELLNTLLGKQ
jgi:hypothetical protein